MPFLFPALIAVISDICIIWLSSYTSHYYDYYDTTTSSDSNNTININNNNNNEDHWVCYTIDIYCGSIPALIRLCIVCIPLLYHSYTGTAIRYIVWYRTIYIGMILLVMIHIISFLIVQPKSIESILLLHQQQPIITNHHLQYYHEYRRLWFILLFNIISLIFHHILLRHVRSTAPTRNMMLRMLNQQNLRQRNLLLSSNQKSYYFLCGNYIQNTMVQPTMYFAVRTAAAAAAAAAATTTTTTTSSSATFTTTDTSTKQNSNQGTTTSKRKLHDPVLPTSLPFPNNNNYNNTEDDDEDNNNDDMERIEQEPALINAMNEFLIDMQIRLQRTKQDWTNRLEDFGHRLQQQQQQQQQGLVSTTTGAGSSTNAMSLSPFRVMLQLFAYEDVLDNHKLDTVFDVDDGAALTFYVPQLLSFLLHGALYTSPALEEWILKKCRNNIYFAHRCYWYLRAWCLESPAESRPITPSISRHNSATSLSHNNLTNGDIALILSQQQHQQLPSNGNEGLPFLDEPAVLEKRQLNKSSNNGSSRNVCLPDNSTNQSSSSQSDGRVSSVILPNGIVVTSPTAVEKDKFLIPEERAMIERFMMRVKECGQIPAYALEFGAATTSTNGASNVSHSSDANLKKDDVSKVVDTIPNGDFNYESVQSPDRSANTLKYRGMNPVRPTTIYSADAEHCNEIDSSVEMKALADEGKIPMDPATGIPSTAHYDALLLRQKSKGYGFRTLNGTDSNYDVTSTIPTSPPRRSETEQFDKTPQFLDALIFLAENLYYIPRENRRETLQQQLRSLECELLPCNSIYLPLGNRNQYHRVWRIVADESIAISTKERVPCIIALEVIDLGVSASASSRSYHESNTTESRSVDEASTENSSASNGANNPTPLSPSVNYYAPNDVDYAAEWRYGQRNPLRYVPFLNKVTTSVKVPFAKMKTQVRHHLNHLRDRGVGEELLALSSADVLVERQNNQRHVSYDIIPSLVEDRHSGARSNATNDGTNVELQQAENGASLTTNGHTAPALSGTNNAVPSVSLGQWSSPSSLQRAVSNPEKQNHDDLNEVRLCLDSALTNRNRRSSHLLYGSDQEDESERSLNTTSGRPPMGRNSQFGNGRVKDIGVRDQVPTRPPPVVFKESWVSKQERVRQKSALGDHPGWKLIAVLIKGNDDLRQEQLAAQLIKRMATILASERVNVWLCPYEIIATTNRGGVIEAIPDTISIDSLKKNDPNYTTLNNFFLSHYGEDTDELAGAKANFVESMAAYSMVCFILQLKDRHNGNILLTKWGHVVHIDFGFFFLSSPGKNAGFESAPFKLTREFVELLEGTKSHLFRTFRELCFRTFIALRRRCMEIILLVEMLKNGNEDLKCFRGRPDDAIQQLRDRFRLDLNDRACKEYVNCLIDDSIENWRTDWYDRYQRYFVGVM